MMFIVARIDHALTLGINWLTTCLVERARGFNSGEAGDFLDDTCLFCGKPQSERYCRPGVLHGGKSPCDWADRLTGFEAENEVAEPDYVRYVTADKGGSYALIEGPILVDRATSHLPQSPAASAARGESSSSEVCDPPAPSEERDCCLTCGCSLESGWCKNCRLAWIRDYQIVPEAVSADPSPAPASGLTWVDWAAPAIVGVLREHRYLLTVGQCSCPCDSRETPPRFNHYTWSEHVAPLIAERLFESIADIQRGTGPYAASEFFPQHRTTQ